MALFAGAAELKKTLQLFTSIPPRYPPVRCMGVSTSHLNKYCRILSAMRIKLPHRENYHHAPHLF